MKGHGGKDMSRPGRLFPESIQPVRKRQRALLHDCPSKAVALPNTLASYWRFLLAGLLKQAQTGGIVPSHRFLTSKMLMPVPENYTGRILALGAGPGALTLRLAAKCPGARTLACERNPVRAKN